MSSIDNKKALAVIILNWNGLELLKKFLPSALEHTVGDDVDLFVADNGSADGSVEWIKANLPGVKLIVFDKNHGFAEGYNHAIEATRYPFTLLLNSDVLVEEGWWQPLLEFMKTHPEAAAVQPKIKSFRDPGKFEYAGAAGGYLDILGYPYCRGRLFDHTEYDNGQYDDDPAEVCWASGAAMMVRTSDYFNAGGLDHRFFAHMEEIDLCCRMHGLGKKVFALPYSSVYHVGGASLAQGNPKKTYLNFRNNLLLLHKNLPEKRGKKIIFIRMLADSLAFLMFLAKFDFANAHAVLKAHRDFKKMKVLYQTFPDNDCISCLPGSKRNIIFDRFILNKKK